MDEFDPQFIRLWFSSLVCIYLLVIVSSIRAYKESNFKKAMCLRHPVLRRLDFKYHEIIVRS